MKESFYKLILTLLIIILAVQGKFIFEMTKNNQVYTSENKNYQNNKAEEVISAKGISLNNLMGLLYNNNKINVKNIGLNDNGKTAEVEVSFQGDWKCVEKVIGELSSDPAFKEIKEYTETAGEPKRAYILYNLK